MTALGFNVKLNIAVSRHEPCVVHRYLLAEKPYFIDPQRDESLFSEHSLFLVLKKNTHSIWK